MANWQPVENAAKNDKGEYLALVAGQWKPATDAAKNADGEFIAKIDDTAITHARPTPKQEEAKQQKEENPAPSFMQKMGDAAIGAMETPAAIATGMGGMALGGIAQAGTALYEAGKEAFGGQRTPGAAQAVGQEVASKFTYQPRSASGQTSTSAIGEALSGFGLLPAAAEKMRETESDLTGGRTTATDIALGAASALPMVKGAGAAKSIKSGEASKAASSAARELGITKPATPANMTEMTFAEGRNHGYVATPSAVSKSNFGKLESIPSKLKVSTATSLKNAATRADDIRKDFGLPPRGEISADELVGVREKVSVAQDRLKESLPELAITDGAKGKINELVSQYSYLKDKFPNLAAGPTKEALSVKVDNLLSADKLSTSDALALVRELRAQADEQLSVAQGKKLNPADKKQGGFNYHLANAIEGMIEENLPEGSPLLKDFREGRKIIAQTYNVQASLNPVTGEVIGRKLASRYDKSLNQDGQTTWSDGLRRAAEQAKAFPTDHGEISRKGGHPALNYWDYLVAGGTAASGHPVIAAAELTARDVLPKIISSKFVQNRLLSKGRVEAAKKEIQRKQRQSDLAQRERDHQNELRAKVKKLQDELKAIEKARRHNAEMKVLSEGAAGRSLENEKQAIAAQVAKEEKARRLAEVKDYEKELMSEYEKGMSARELEAKLAKERAKRKKEIESLMRQAQGIPK